MNVCIRADGNAEIAMGHVMRCLSIADAMSDLGAEIYFITAAADTYDLIRKRGYENIILGTDFHEMETEIPALQKALTKTQADLLLVDSYFVTNRYFHLLKGCVRTAYLDDFGDTAYEVDAVINYNVYGDKEHYQRLYHEQNLPIPSGILMGCDYAPLRKEFQRPVTAAKKDKAEKLLLSTGGGDIAGAARKICTRLLQEKERGKFSRLQVEIVCGPYAKDKEWLKELSGKDNGFAVRENVTKMSELMDECDIAITACGSTVYELCSRKLPFVTFIFAENQRQMAEWLDLHTEMKYAGNIVKQPEAVLDALMEHLEELYTDATLRNRIKEQQERITDGYGAVKLAESLLKG